MPDSLVSTVVITYNSKDYVSNCISCLKEQSYKNHGILVVDNGSTDGTINYLNCRSDITVLLKHGNFGYADGINEGIRWAQKEEAKYLFILNPDINMRPDTLAILVEKAENNPEVGAFGPAVIQRAWGDKGLGNINNPEDDKLAHWISGCGILLRMDAVYDVGLFDTGYFLYFEESDYLHRLQQKHWRIMKVNSVVLEHFGGASTRLMPTKSEYYLIRNIFRYAMKNVIQEGVSKTISFIIWHLRNKFYFPMHPLRFCAFVVGMFRGSFYLVPVFFDFVKRGFLKR